MMSMLPMFLQSLPVTHHTRRVLLTEQEKGTRMYKIRMLGRLLRLLLGAIKEGGEYGC